MAAPVLDTGAALLDPLPHLVRATPWPLLPFPLLCLPDPATCMQALDPERITAWLTAQGALSGPPAPLRITTFSHGMGLLRI